MYVFEQNCSHRSWKIPRDTINTKMIVDDDVCKITGIEMHNTSQRSATVVLSSSDMRQQQISCTATNTWVIFVWATCATHILVLEPIWLDYFLCLFVSTLELTPLLCFIFLAFLYKLSSLFHLTYFPVAELQSLKMFWYHKYDWLVATVIENCGTLPSPRMAPEHWLDNVMICSFFILPFVPQFEASRKNNNQKDTFEPLPEGSPFVQPVGYPRTKHLKIQKNAK